MAKDSSALTDDYSSVTAVERSNRSLRHEVRDRLNLRLDSFHTSEEAFVIRKSSHYHSDFGEDLRASFE
ncbi:MAG: TraY domain-containing protein [bacterium]|uniref:TraY domain-containing protein n=1 Tax=Gemmatimonas sp. TaxID=1962908 RepID=UPI003919337F